MTIEIWKPIMGFEDIYEISNKGNVRKIKGAIILKGQLTQGYKKIILTKNRKRYNFFIHRLVAKAFIPNPNNYPIINHIDENPLNNNVDNLEWCSYKYNTNYGTCIERRSRNHYKSVNQYKNGYFVKKWECIKLAGKSLNIDTSSITKAAKGLRKSAGGYVWQYDC